MTRRIDSPDNPTLKRVRSLRDSRRRRWTERAFVVEGPRLVSDLIAVGMAPEVLLVGDGLPPTSPMRDLAHVEVAPRAMAAVEDTEHGQGVVAVFPFPELGLRSATPRLVLLVDRVQDPGNVGTLLRSAAASGADAVWLTPGAADPFNPKVVRAAAAAHGVVAIAVGEPDELLDRGLRLVVAAAGPDALPIDEVDWSIPSVLAVGSEGAGVSDEVRRRADAHAVIPMEAGVESLNAGVAGSVILFEAARQRRRAARG